MSHLGLLQSELESFQIELRASQKLRLAMYCDELSRWNQKINLTALSGFDLVRRLVVEPVWIARQLSLGGSLVDIGSGNGSPAIPFRIVCRFRACHLVEARARRAAFLRHLAVTLKLPDVTVHRARFEQIAATIQNPDWISLRAVALTENLINSIRLIAHHRTSVVWITSPQAQTPWDPRRSFTVPITGTQVFLFDMDLS